MMPYIGRTAIDASNVTVKKTKTHTHTHTEYTTTTHEQKPQTKKKKTTYPVRNTQIHTK